MLRLRVSLMEKHGDMVSIVKLNHQLPRYVHTLIFWYFYLFLFACRRIYGTNGNCGGDVSLCGSVKKNTKAVCVLLSAL